MTMFKNKFKIDLITSYVNNKIDKDYVEVTEFSPNGQQIIGSFSIRKVDIQTVIDLLTNFK